MTFLLALLWSTARRFQIDRVVDSGDVVQQGTFPGTLIADLLSLSFALAEATPNHILEEEERVKRALLAFASELSMIDVQDFTKAFRDGKVLAKMTDKLASVFEDRPPSTTRHFEMLVDSAHTSIDPKHNLIDAIDKTIWFNNDNYRVRLIVALPVLTGHS